jgi:hypothetical protein
MDELDFRVDERVEERHGGAARQPEDVFDPLALEALNQLLRSRGHFLSERRRRRRRRRGAVFRGSRWFGSGGFAPRGGASCHGRRFLS